MKRKFTIPALLLAGVVALAIGVSPAFATHLTSLTATPATQSVDPGQTATYTGTVGTTTDCGVISSYGFALSQTGAPAGSTVTFTPASGAPNGPLSVNYTLDIAVPTTATPGTYPISIQSYFSDQGLGQCVDGSRFANVSLDVVDITAPTASCDLGVNPSGKKEPNANAGFRQVNASDNVGVISLVITGGTFTSGQLVSGNNVKLTFAPGSAGSDVRPGPGVLTASITTNGQPYLVATDAAGNTTSVPCGPLPPKNQT
jgi:hypothetical protein